MTESSGDWPVRVYNLLQNYEEDGAPEHLDNAVSELDERERKIAGVLEGNESHVFYHLLDKTESAADQGYSNETLDRLVEQYLDR
jgi:hypothetical protein